MDRRKSVRKSSTAKMGMCGCTAKMGMCGCTAKMGMCGAYAKPGVKNYTFAVKVGSMKLLVNKHLNTIYRASDEKYIGKIHKTEKGLYFMNNGKRVYLPVLESGKRKASKVKSRKRKASKVKSRKRKVKKPLRCTIQKNAKYMDRPSPPYPANKCCGSEMKGNDGNMYVSKRDVHGVCRWKKL